MSGYEEGSLESDGGIYHRDGYASVSVAGAIPYVVKHVYSPTRACLIQYTVLFFLIQAGFYSLEMLELLCGIQI